MTGAEYPDPIASSLAYKSSICELWAAGLYEDIAAQPTLPYEDMAAQPTSPYEEDMAAPYEAFSAYLLNFFYYLFYSLSCYNLYLLIVRSSGLLGASTTTPHCHMPHPSPTTTAHRHRRRCRHGHCMHIGAFSDCLGSVLLLRCQVDSEGLYNYGL